MKIGSRGFSLVQVMVAMALLGVVALMMMNLMKQGAQTQKTIDKNQDILQEMSRAQSILKDNDTCNLNFQGKTFTAEVSLTSGLIMSAGSANPFLKPGSKGPSGLLIKDVIWEAPKEVSPKGLSEFSIRILFERDSATAVERTTLSSAELTKRVTFFAVQCSSKGLYATSDPSAPYSEKRLIAMEQMEESCVGGYIDEESFQEAASNFWVATCLYNCGAGQPIAKCAN